MKWNGAVVLGRNLGALVLVVGLSACTSKPRAKEADPGPNLAQYLPMLLREIRATDPTVRQGAAIALGRIGCSAREALPALTCALGDPDPRVRKCVAYALGRIAPDLAPSFKATGLKTSEPVKDEPSLALLTDSPLERVSRSGPRED